MLVEPGFANLKCFFGHEKLNISDKNTWRFDMEEKITCELFVHADSVHLQQLYTGFSILHRKGIIRLIQRICRENIMDKTKDHHLWDAKLSHLKVIIDGESALYYDTHDSFEVD